MVQATPEAIEAQFVSFQPHFPLGPGSLDLFGYETSKQAKAFVIYTPDKSKMVVTEVFFLPQNNQTLSRINVVPVGPMPDLSELLPPERLQELEKKKQSMRASNPNYTPTVKLSEIDARKVWARYLPQTNWRNRHVALEAGFDVLSPHRVDIMHVADWDKEGKRLLIAYRPGVHHLGVWRTVPVIYRPDNGKMDKLAHLPQLLYQAAQQQNPHLKQRMADTWDIRILGWHASDPDALVAKLVGFQGQSEWPAGYWQYNIETGTLTSLGDAPPETEIARNGLVATFKNPNAPEGAQTTYGPGETPPQDNTLVPAPKRRSWRDRLPFRKK